MRLISNKRIIEFSNVFPNAYKPLQSWRKIMEFHSFENFAQLKAIFGSVDKVDDLIVFDTNESLKIEQPKIKSLKLVSSDDPILKEVMPDFNFQAKPYDPIELASALVETCKLNKGYGLSANQCGVRARVFVMGAGEEYVAFFNPKIGRAHV